MVQKISIADRVYNIQLAEYKRLLDKDIKEDEGFI